MPWLIGHNNNWTGIEMAHTKKPCPGCGQVDRGRKPDQVCDDCRQKLTRVAEIEAECDALRATVANALAVATKPCTPVFSREVVYRLGSAQHDRQFGGVSHLRAGDGDDVQGDDRTVGT